MTGTHYKSRSVEELVRDFIRQVNRAVELEERYGNWMQMSEEATKRSKRILAEIDRRTK